MRLAVLVAVTAAACAPSRAAPPAPTAAEREAYDRYRRPERVIAALDLRAGMRVADVGAGRGYLTHRLAAAVAPNGRVVATDIDGEALGAIDDAAANEAPIERRQVRADDPSLERASYDRILLAEVDHLLGDRADFLARLSRALAPDGRIAVSNRKLYRAPLLAAAERAGLRVLDERHDLPAHFLVLLVPR